MLCLALPREEEGRQENQQRRQREREADHEQEHEHVKDHHHSRNLKWGAGRASLRNKHKGSLLGCQASGRDARIIHHRESLYLCSSCFMLEWKELL